MIHHLTQKERDSLKEKIKLKHPERTYYLGLFDWVERIIISERTIKE